MPKMKSKGAVKGRFRVTKSGKVKGSRPARGHMHASKNAKQARTLRKPLMLNSTWSGLMRKMLGGKV
jgi:ribosomal protein L35